MDAAPPGGRFRRGWSIFIEVFVALWLLALVLVTLQGSYHLFVLLPAPWIAPARLALFWVFPLFILNLYLQYRWSGMGRGEFVRKRWLDILMVIPALRALQFVRVFQVGRAGVVVRALNNTRRTFSLVRKSRRKAGQLKAARARAAATKAGASAAAAAGLAATNGDPSARGLLQDGASLAPSVPAVTHREGLPRADESAG